MFTSIVDRIKWIIGAIVAILGVIFGFVFVRRGKKINKLEEKIKQEKINANTIEKKLEHEKKITEVEKKIAQDSIKVANHEEKKIKKIKKKIENTPDDEEYEVLL